MKRLSPLLLYPGLIGRAFHLSLWTGYFYYGMEWLFFATKPSLFSYLTGSEQLAVLLVSPVPVTGFAALTAVLATALAARTRGSAGPAARLGLVVAALLPASILTGAEFLMLANFAYVMFGFGVDSLRGGMQILLAIPLVLGFAANVRLLGRKIAGPAWSRSQRGMAAGLSGLLVASSGLALAAAPRAAPGTGLALAEGPIGRDAPNVLVLASDGISASHMSAYGYGRATTPAIDGLRAESLVFENHFSNASKTTGAVAALLSGKLPTTTRVIFRPDVFTGAHVYQHLPGVLRRHGYTNADISIRHYVDPYDLNMRDGFHYANGRDLGSEGVPLPRWFRTSYPWSTLFGEETHDRLRTRVAHVLGLRPMVNPYLAVTRPERVPVTDRQRIDELVRFLSMAPRPFFAHVHLMNTHGPTFEVSKPFFSRGQLQSGEWLLDFYDDAVLQYDRYVEEVVEELKRRELLDQTVLILNTDHGFRWGVNEPLPLLVRFPRKSRVGVVTTTSQRIDLAPTILESVGIPVPDWMEGHSLLGDGPDPTRPVVVAHRAPSHIVEGWSEVAAPEAPFYTLGALSMIYCDLRYDLDLLTPAIRVQRVRGRTTPCDPSELPTPRRAREALFEHLSDAGYEIRDLTDRLRGEGQPRATGEQAGP